MGRQKPLAMLGVQWQLTEQAARARRSSGWVCAERVHKTTRQMDSTACVDQVKADAQALAAEPTMAGASGAAGEVFGSADRSTKELLKISDALQPSRWANSQWLK